MSEKMTLSSKEKIITDSAFLEEDKDRNIRKKFVNLYVIILLLVLNYIIQEGGRG